MPELHLPDGAVYKTGDSVVAVKREHWDGETVRGVVVKSSDELRYTLTIGYPADTPDRAVARDGHLDFANPDEVRKAAWGFMQHNPEVGARHEDGTEGAGTIVESYLWPDGAPDWHLTAADGSEVVIKSGDWLIGTIWGDAAWQGFKTGEYGGTSMQGRASRKTPTPADLARVVGAKRG